MGLAPSSELPTLPIVAVEGVPARADLDADLVLVAAESQPEATFSPSCAGLGTMQCEPCLMAARQLCE